MNNRSRWPALSGTGVRRVPGSFVESPARKLFRLRAAPLAGAAGGTGRESRAVFHRGKWLCHLFLPNRMPPVTAATPPRGWCRSDTRYSGYSAPTPTGTRGPVSSIPEPVMVGAGQRQIFPHLESCVQPRGRLPRSGRKWRPSPPPALSYALFSISASDSDAETLKRLAGQLGRSKEGWLDGARELPSEQQLQEGCHEQRSAADGGRHPLDARHPSS